jgi:feruloyl-CoA synthase
MTSGSTSLPKGVVTTQRMLCVNQTQIASALPFLMSKPPVIVDWLPWNHVFGGSHNFNMMLANGGSLYIDEGKPVKALFGTTIENLNLIAGTLSFNVPVGFSLLLEALENDPKLAMRYFENLDMIFYAGASLPQGIWQGLEKLAKQYSGTVPLLTSSWGLTETAPACTLQHEPPQSSGVIGVPLPGVSVKLLPQEGEDAADQRYEIRVKGPNIFESYFNDKAKSKEAFDEEGYFQPQDAVKFVDPQHPEKGLRFDGRISEDFKLTSGTWVRAAQLRLDLLACLAPIAADLVITGHDRDQIGLIIFPNREAISATGFETTNEDGLVKSDAMQKEICAKLIAFSKGGSSSTRIAYALIAAEPVSLADGEVTAKGNLNFRAILNRRAELVEKLYTTDFDGKIIVE